MTDVFIIGKGPAGISASLYTVRAGLTTVVTGKDRGALGKADRIDNYYGFAEGITAGELFENGIKGAERLGATVLSEEVFDIVWEDEIFRITTDRGIYEAKTVILATGTGRKAPPVKGLKDREGRGVSYCAVCDGFFFRQKEVCVIGSGRYAVSEALHLTPTSSKVTLLTNGRDLEADAKELLEDAVKNGTENLFLETGKIAEITGEPMVSGVRMEGGREIDASGVFVAEGTASATDLARKLGAADPEGKLMLNEDMATPVPGFFAAGDCTGGLLQVAKAVSDGAVAGTSAGKFLRSKKK
jgi:thioredoxin reductase (NADPH)